MGRDRNGLRAEAKTDDNLLMAQRRLRVAHVIDSLDVSGGAEKQLIANLRAFDRDRLTHELILIKSASESRLDDVPDDIETTILFPDQKGVARRQIVTRLVQQARAEKYDLMHAALPDSALATRAVGMATRTLAVESLVNISHEGIRTVDNPAVTNSKLRAHSMLDRLSMKGIDRFHAVSSAVADSWCRTVGLDRQRIVVIPRGVDHGQLGAVRDLPDGAHVETRATLGVDADAFLVVSVGRQEPQKGHRYLIEAAHRARGSIDRLRVVIVGREGNSTTAIKDLVDQLGASDTVQLAGPRHDVAEILAASDVFAFPSLFEGNGGNAMIEARAAGLPIITTNAEPMTDLVPDDGVGMLIERFDVEALSRALVKLFNDKGLRAKLGEAAYQRALTFPSPEKVAKQVENWYFETLSDKKPLKT